MEKTGFFEASPGNKSSSRLIAIMVVGAAIILTSIIVCSMAWIALESKSFDGFISGLTGAGVFFTTMAGTVLIWMFNQKKTENADRPEKAGCTDPKAKNFDPEATIDNGTCIYEAIT